MESADPFPRLITGDIIRRQLFYEAGLRPLRLSCPRTHNQHGRDTAWDGRPITAHTGTAELCPRLMPSRFILEINVVRGRPSRAAAPSRPPTTPSVCWRV